MEVKGDRIVRMRDLPELTGLSRSTLYLRMKAGQFPPGKKLAGARAVGWSMREVQEWIRSVTESIH